MSQPYLRIWGNKNNVKTAFKKGIHVSVKAATSQGCLRTQLKRGRRYIDCMDSVSDSPRTKDWDAPLYSCARFMKKIDVQLGALRHWQVCNHEQWATADISLVGWRSKLDWRVTLDEARCKADRDLRLLIPCVHSIRGTHHVIVHDVFRDWQQS